MCIALFAEVFVFPILQSPHYAALIFRTGLLHTAWEILHENGGSERQAAGHGCTGRADNTNNNTKHKELLIQEYCEVGIQNQSDKTYSETKTHRY